MIWFKHAVWHDACRFCPRSGLGWCKAGHVICWLEFASAELLWFVESNYWYVCEELRARHFNFCGVGCALSRRMSRLCVALQNLQACLHVIVSCCVVVFKYSLV
jgi:hypothetical protein